MGDTKSVKVSVIVPVYNVCEEYLRECMDSILAQSMPDWELIAVDDGSMGGNGDVLDEYALKDSRVRVIHQENMGASGARNTGLENASGEYVTFVDSDDTIDETTFEKAVSAAEEGQLDILLWGSYKVYSDHKDKYSPFIDDIKLFNEKQKECVELKAFAGTLPIYEYPASKFGSGSCCSKLYRRDFLNEHGLRYPVGIARSEDVNFNIRAFEAAGRMGYMNEYLYYYRQLSDSASFKYRDGGISVFDGALRLLKEFVCENQKPDFFMQAYYMRCMFFFLESMDMDYLHPDNKKSISGKIKEMRFVAGSEPYKEAFKNLKYSSLSFAKRIPLFLIRCRFMGLLMLFYKVYRKL